MRRYARYAAKPDKSQQPIVEALEARGLLVWAIRHPVDLLVYIPWQDRWQPLECKTKGRHVRKKGGPERRLQSQIDQEALCKACGIPVVETPEQALSSLGIDWQRPREQSPVPPVISMMDLPVLTDRLP